MPDDYTQSTEWLADVLVDAILKMSDDEILAQFADCTFAEARNAFMMRALFEKMAFERQHRLS